MLGSSLRRVFLGLGANLGDPAQQMESGIERLVREGTLLNPRWSSFYESEPVGWEGGPWYLNAVVEAWTALTPQALLKRCKEAEKNAGREFTARNAPRPLDIDILLYQGTPVNEPDLKIPHPRMLERAFVLWPLLELGAEVEVAPGILVKDVVDRLKAHERIHRLETACAAGA